MVVGSYILLCRFDVSETVRPSGRTCRARTKKDRGPDPPPPIYEYKYSRLQYRVRAKLTRGGGDIL